MRLVGAPCTELHQAELGCHQRPRRRRQRGQQRVDLAAPVGKEEEHLVGGQLAQAHQIGNLERAGLGEVPVDVKSIVDFQTDVPVRHVLCGPFQHEAHVGGGNGVVVDDFAVDDGLRTVVNDARRARDLRGQYVGHIARRAASGHDDLVAVLLPATQGGAVGRADAFIGAQECVVQVQGENHDAVCDGRIEHPFMSSIIPHPAKSRNQNDKVCRYRLPAHLVRRGTSIVLYDKPAGLPECFKSMRQSHPRATEGRKRNSPVAGIGEMGCSGSSGGSGVGGGVGSWPPFAATMVV